MEEQEERDYARWLNSEDYRNLCDLAGGTVMPLLSLDPSMDVGEALQMMGYGIEETFEP
jgi:hypothetical protein